MAASTRVSESTGISLPKWQIALAIGAPVALGLGFWYYRSRKGTQLTKDKSSDVEKQAPKIVAAVEAVSTGESKTQNGNPPAVVSAAPVAPVVEEVTDPYKLAQVNKNKGNKSFKEGKYADAINCYAQAIEVCPKTKVSDISTFYQNRAAAYEQLVSIYYYFLIKIFITY